MPRSAEQWVALAESIPNRPLPLALHTYIKTVRDIIDGHDPLNIPPSHQTLMAAENHEASSRLNTRIRQLAAWFAKGDPRVRAVPSGPGETVQTGASQLERFVRQGERAFARGVPLHNYKQECARDLAECGFAVYLQTPRRDYYDQAEYAPEQMAEGTALTALALRRRIDPLTFSFTERIGGKLAETVVSTDRHLGELGGRIGYEEAGRALNYMNLSEAIDSADALTWDITVRVAEVWDDDAGALVFMGAGEGSSLKDGVDVAKLDAQDRVLKTWINVAGRTPFYIAKVGPQPWHSPIDEMVQLSTPRSFWATMLDIQASGAIFRHWQLTDSDTGDDLTNKLYIGRDSAPEHLLYDLSKPPPDMGPGTEWKLAPFEFHDVVPRYTQIREDHESAGASVARLSGQVVSASTPVGTADFIDDAAQAEFGDWVEALDIQACAAWYDMVFVTDKRRDSENDPTSYLSTTTAITADDIVTDEVEIATDRRSRLSKIADYRLFSEMRSNGDMEYATGVELGYIPGVDDAAAELDAIYVAQAARIQAETRLRVIQQQAMQALTGTGGEMPDPNPNIAGGARSDPRGTGTQRGPLNVSDTALAAGASDIARSA